MRVYVTGPRPFDWAALARAASDLRGRGWRPVLPDGNDGKAVIVHGLRAVCEDSLEGVVVLPGWWASRTASFVAEAARQLGKPVWAYPTLDPQ